MTLDLSTFLTALHTIVDDLYQEHYAELKPLCLPEDAPRCLTAR